MKYVVISRLGPGVDSARKAFDVFQKAGLPSGTESIWAGADGKTFVSVVDSDTPDMVAASTYAPFFEESTVMPVVALDDGWIEGIRTAQANWD
jgi:hypothetical protein